MIDFFHMKANNKERHNFLKVFGGIFCLGYIVFDLKLLKYKRIMLQQTFDHKTAGADPEKILTL